MQSFHLCCRNGGALSWRCCGSNYTPGYWGPYKQWVAPRCRCVAVDGTNARRNPVATVAIGKAGAKNAAYLASQILATSDDSLFERVRADREKNKDKVISQNQALQETLSGS